MINKNPVAPVGKLICSEIMFYYTVLGQAVNAVKNALNVQYDHDPDLLSDIISALPKRIESGLNLHRTSILGKVPRTREDFDPRMLLDKVEGGGKVIVLDSNTDLPTNWHDIDLKAKYGVSGGVGGTGGDASDGLSSGDDGLSSEGSDGGPTSDDDMARQDIPVNDPEDEDVDLDGGEGVDPEDEDVDLDGGEGVGSAQAT